MNTLLLRWGALLLLCTPLMLVATSVLAEEPGTPEAKAEAAAEAEMESAAVPPGAGFNKTLSETSVALDTIWVMVAGFLVMFMQVGFTMVEAGLTRAKNAVNICMKNLVDFSIGGISYWALGFGLMFSLGSPLVGYSGFFLKETTVEVEEADGAKRETTNFDPISWTDVPLDTKFFFQMVFAATAATIVSGAMAERMNFPAYILASAAITAFIYPISGHWIWGGGWLAEYGFWDFAGSTTVHSVGAWMALVGAFVLGPRAGKYDANGKSKAIPGHSVPLLTLGVFVLWLGWFGFNPGSTMAADAASIAKIAVVTNAAAGAGALTAMFTAKALFKKWEATMALNGVLAGLVGITAACAWVSIPSALIIGGIAGVLVVFSVVFIDQKLKVDDPVGAISVHGVCGVWATLAVGLFSEGGEGAPLKGLFLGGGAEQLIKQAVGVGAVFAWCLVTGAILFFGLKFTIGLRASAEHEAEGLDITEHGNEAYHGFQFIHDGV